MTSFPATHYSSVAPVYNPHAWHNGKRACGSKIGSTKRTVIMSKNLRVLAINVRVSLYRYISCNVMFYYKRMYVYNKKPRI